MLYFAGVLQTPDTADRPRRTKPENGMHFLTKILLTCLAIAGTPAYGQGTPPLSTGQLLYLPIYSHVWHGEVDRKGQPTKSLVSVLVSVRNTDTTKSIRVESARYFDTGGKMLREYVKSPINIGPMGTYELFVPRSDDTGGSGANFVIAWKGDSPANLPLVEAVHVNLPAGRSIAFVTSAREITVPRP